MKYPQWLVRRRHYGDSLLIAVYVALAVVDLTLPTHGLLNNLSTVLFVPAVVLSFALSASHDRGEVCERCIQIVPLNIDQRVSRRRPWLWSHHMIAGSGIRVVVFYFGLFALILVGALLHGWTYRVVECSIDLLLAWRFSTVLVHRHLFPWCPWCRNGGRGDSESEETPAPVVPQAV